MLSVYFGMMPRYSDDCVLAMKPTPHVKTAIDLRLIDAGIAQRVPRRLRRAA